MLIAARIVPLLVFVLWAYCVLDAIASDSALVQNLPKLFWVFIVLLFPPIGAIAWLLLGRPEGASWRIGGRGAPRRRPHPPRGMRSAPPPDLPPARPPIDPGARKEAIRRYEEERRRRRGLGPGEDLPGSGNGAAGP